VTTVPRRGLQIDDPLASSQVSREDKPPGESVGHTPPATIQEQRAQSSPGASADRQPSKRARTANKPRRTSGAEHGLTDTAAHSGDSGVWRAWSGISGVGSFRLPHELLVELGDTARELELPIGMIVTAAIAQLLDQPAEQIAALVDKADDARIHGRRNARRRHNQPADR
jgi:hypothetical protein